MALTSRQILDRALPESEWQKQVEEALTLHQWDWWHVPANVVVCPTCRRKIYRGIRKGFPDILAIKPPFLIWIELKTETGVLDPDQKAMHHKLRACGQTVLHARPRDREWLFALISNPGGHT